MEKNTPNLELNQYYDDVGEVLWEVLERTAFDRIINSVHSFCLFMRNLRVPDDTVLIPPDSGWPHITKESFVGLGKNDRAVDVLRHMTYLKARSDQQQILPENALFNWHRLKKIPTNSETAKGAHVCTESPSEPAPPDVIGLLSGGAHTGILLLNCKYGIVHWNGDCNDDKWKELGHDCHLERLIPGERNDDAKPRDGTNWMVQDFFELIKRQFITMKQLPFDSYQVLNDDSEIYYPGAMQRLREIYGKHGWPDKYDKRACIAELEDFRVTDYWQDGST